MTRHLNYIIKLLYYNSMKRKDKFEWIIEKEGNMRVPGIIFASEKLMESIRNDNAAQQVKNVAHLPGICKYSMAMPDIHWGYGFPIGGVAAMDMDDGVISPGGVGYDINCGVRVLKTSLTYEDIKGKIKDITNRIYSNVPSGVGSTGDVRITDSQLRKLLLDGVAWAVRNGFGWDADIEYTEERGCLEGADPDILSDRALSRGKPQLGTLGSGNHFVEIQRVDEIFNRDIAAILGIEENQITVMIHTGSRGLGHQVCSDWVKELQKATGKYKIELPDRELICAPIKSKEGREYISAMKAAANFAWVNRQIIMSKIRCVFSESFGKSSESLKMNLIYDVAHNIAKFENHVVDGEEKRLCVHRKGATRAFPPNHPDLPPRYRSTGQPVLIPGDMGTASYILTGTEESMKITFGSTCHGAGRLMSRRQAIKATGGRNVTNELAEKSIYIRADSIKTIREETPDAYKNIDEVVRTVDELGISRKIARTVPVAVVKG